MKTVTLAPGLTLIHGDCMEYLATLPDGAFDLAVVDPPYGIGDFNMKNHDGVRKDKWSYTWNNSIPSHDYFSQLRRTSKNRIVWGANYFNSFETSGGAIVWFKDVRHPNMSKCEIASSSFHRKVEYVRMDWSNTDKYNALRGADIHPCEKPVALYRWLLQNYAKPGQTILDTHLGSGSSAIAAWEMGYTFTGIEIDKDYFDAAVERISKRLLSPYLPGIAGNEGKGQVEQVKLFCD